MNTPVDLRARLSTLGATSDEVQTRILQEMESLCFSLASNDLTANETYVLLKVTLESFQERMELQSPAAERIQ